MSGPYQKVDKAWLTQNEPVFRSILKVAGHHREDLRKLETMFNPLGTHILDFLDVSRPELETALRVCEKLMEGLGPTAQAMREELERRELSSST